MRRGGERRARGTSTMFTDPLTAVHTLISIAAIVLGIPAIGHLLARSGPDRWTGAFLTAAVLTTATGFLLPFIGFTPAFATGIVAGLVLLLVIVARYRHHRAGRWRALDAVGLVVSLYLLVFVLIAQLFDKVPPLNALAPTGSEPAFAVAQLVCLAVFVWIGWKALRHTRSSLRA
jgi:hypothetical protein